MMGLGNLIRRNSKLFFKDKAMFFTSLITPIICSFYIQLFSEMFTSKAFLSAIPTGFELSEKLINAVVAGQLVSSLLAVCCVTVSFCSNMLMVQDKVSGARADLTVTPVKKSTLAVSYYISTLISTLAICVAASVICFIYLSNIGWYLSFKETVLFLLDVILLVMFGTALSSIINFFFKLTRSDFRSRDHRQRRIWIYLWRIYARLKLFCRTAKSYFFFAGYIRHGTFTQSRFKRCFQ